MTTGSADPAPGPAPGPPASGARGSWPRCAFVAEEQGDRREGTAPPAQRWLLLEHSGPWGRTALTQSGLAPDVVAAVSTWASAAAARVLLVRRPGRAPRATGPRRWFRVDARPGREEIRTGTVAGPADYAAAVHDAGERHDEPLALVCAHGRHDTCCAVRGRPLAAALGSAAWEASHLGGCRFAPSVVLLPHGYVFGGVPVEQATALLRGYAEDGVVDPRWMRGRTVFTPAVQAAQCHARSATGARGVDALALVAAVEEEPGTWRVDFADPGCRVRLRERTVDTGRPLTCAATRPGRVRVFDLVEAVPVAR